ncbi:MULTISPECIES: ABATE domain-containing protein [unclassified Mesorhizobium]|uniref:CGNR zinc finger domain-containing protein n=1 Tax=unclassified Mesorhizobium TaxID=325217 RepID=UPI001FE1CFDE|nr:MULTISPECIES: ABATE domain-containing protein [unclassified Mesorhizobium]
MSPIGSTTSPKPRATRVAERHLANEDLAIRFVNTAAWRLRSDVEERLPSPEALLDWFHANDLVSRGERTALQRAWKSDVEAANSLYESAIALRELIYNLLIARIDGQTPRTKDLEAFNHFLTAGGVGATLAWRAGDYAWRATKGVGSLLTPITLSAAELLTGIRSGKIRQCQDERGCGWLFVDESRAQNRRWCSMGDCGNRAKAHRHYQRAKGYALKSD